MEQEYAPKTLLFCTVCPIHTVYFHYTNLSTWTGTDIIVNPPHVSTFPTHPQTPDQYTSLLFLVIRLIPPDVKITAYNNDR